ncbi:winged helix-turn-helix domain-containing protein [Vibrio sp. SCSIO 43136]|uniref:winged helix-turn-helix domain-containing protein n=1 Tax=Vibrio sp. SCSIO 43136 TaxID=2819101 RepID=UPI0033659430
MQEYLQHAGFNSHLIDDGADAIPWLRTNTPDLILLDLMLPNRDGLDIFRELRTFSEIPVIMATAKVEEIDRLLGLELGADDYICKPYSPREVIARIKNVLRRSQKATAPRFKHGLELDQQAMICKLNGNELTLTPAEFRLLNHLFDHQGRIFSRDQLIDCIYDDHRVVSDRTIDSHIKNLRKKMQKVDPESDYIKSIYSVGYKMELPLA